MKRNVILYGVTNENMISKIKDCFNILYITGFDEAKKGKYYFGFEYIPLSNPIVMSNVVLVCNENEKDAESNVMKIRERNIYAETIKNYSLNELRRNTLHEEIREFWLYGDVNECQTLDRILSINPSIKIKGYTTHDPKEVGQKNIYNRPVSPLSIAIDEINNNRSMGIIAIFERFGFENILRFIDRRILDGNQFFICETSIYNNVWSEKEFDKLFVPYRNSKRHNNVQFMLAKHCNLNCKLCTHFSPLDSKKHNYNYDQYEKDLYRIRELIDVDVVGLWGGEALLCPQVERYIYKAREVFPDSRIMIGSNGLIIPRLDEKILEALHETRTIVSVSLYPPTIKRFEQIKNTLNKYKIVQRYPQSMQITRFARKYDPTGQNEINYAWQWCPEKQCTTVFEGRISGCYFPLLSCLYNERFGKTFDTSEDIIDLYDEKLTSEKLLAILRHPMNSCRYCGDLKWEEWSTCGTNSVREDWCLS